METAAPSSRHARPKWVVILPYAWLAAFFLLPFLIVLKISLSEAALARPPYTPMLDLATGWEGLKRFVAGLSLANYATLASDRLYIAAYVQSVVVASVSTLILLALGYPVAYAMARTDRRLQGFLVMLVILPFWTSFLIRVYAWINILQRDGLLNQALLALGIVREPVGWLSTNTAVLIGIVYSYFPFMVLPLYAALEKMDPSLEEAAADLGARPLRVFWSVIVPLSRPGIVAGALLCFIPIVGEFVIPDLLGGSRTLMIGQTLWTEFFGNRDWPLASAAAVVLLCLLLFPILIYQHRQSTMLERGV